MISGANYQVFALLKEGLTATQIAEALGYDKETIETVIQLDPTMRRVQEDRLREELDNSSQEEKLDKKFQNLEDTALHILDNLVQTSENDMVKLMAAKMILQQRLGCFKSKLPKGNVNINIANYRLDREKAKQISGQVIEAESTVSKQEKIREAKEIREVSHDSSELLGNFSGALALA
jgi:hypothetical protein